MDSNAPNTHTRGRIALALAAAAIALTATGVSGTALAADHARHATGSIRDLPAPTGSFAVGERALVVGTGSRRVETTVWYPARAARGKRAPYAPRAATAALAAALGIEEAVLARVRTHARKNAPSARGRRPLLLLSPGYQSSRFLSRALGEDLASRGYVVVAVDHAREHALTETDFERRAVRAARVADLRRVLARMRRDPHVDQRRIGAIGHSLGGSAVASMMTATPAIRAGIDLDGTLFDGPPRRRQEAFLVLAHDGHDAESDPSLAGSRLRTLRGSGHWTFTDLPALAAAMPSDSPWRAELGTVGARRAFAWQRTEVHRFFQSRLGRRGS